MSSEIKIKALLILEILGKPAEHLVKALDEHIDAMDKEQGVVVTNKSVKSPQEIEDKKGFFSSFAEVDVEADNIMHMAMLMFKYMPSHVEIISPENLQMTNSQFSEVLSELTRRLHGYDEVARVIQMEKAVLEKKLKALMPEDKNGKKQK